MIVKLYIRVARWQLRRRWLRVKRFVTESIRGADVIYPACPDHETLRDFAVGMAGGAEWESTARHIEECPDCQAKCEQLDRENDELLVHLQRVGTESQTRGARSPSPDERAAIEAASRFASARWRVAADAGRDLAHRLLEGPVLLDRFELRSELGIGSFGYVFQAWDSRLERVVALKVQRAGSLASNEDVERFLREARSAAQLKHPAIVSLYETGQTADGVWYLVSEYVGGSTLEERLKGGPLPGARGRGDRHGTGRRASICARARRRPPRH